MTETSSLYLALDALMKSNGWSVGEVATRLRALDPNQFSKLQPSTVFRWLERRSESGEVQRTVASAIQLLQQASTPPPVVRVAMLRRGAALLPARLLAVEQNSDHSSFGILAHQTRLDVQLVDTANEAIEALSTGAHLAIASRHWLSAYGSGQPPFLRLSEVARLPIEALFRKGKMFDERKFGGYIFGTPRGTAYDRCLENFGLGVACRKVHIATNLVTLEDTPLEVGPEIDGFVGDPLFIDCISGKCPDFALMPQLLFGVNYVDIFVAKRLPREITLHVILNYLRALRESISFVLDWLAREESNDTPRVRKKRAEPGSTLHRLFGLLEEIFGPTTPMLKIVEVLKKYVFFLGPLETSTVLELWSTDRSTSAYDSLYADLSALRPQWYSPELILARYALRVGLLQDALEWVRTYVSLSKRNLLPERLLNDPEFAPIQNEIRALIDAKK